MNHTYQAKRSITLRTSLCAGLKIAFQCWWTLWWNRHEFFSYDDRRSYITIPLFSANLLNGDSPYPQTGPIGKVLPLPTPVEITARTNGEGSDEDVSSSPVSSLDKRHAHTHTMSTRRVCWHRNTSISMTEHSLSVRVSIELASWIHNRNLCYV